MTDLHVTINNGTLANFDTWGQVEITGFGYDPNSPVSVFCLDPDVPFTPIQLGTQAYKIFSSDELARGVVSAETEPDPPGSASTLENLDLVNWLLNQETLTAPYTAGEIQAAIWLLLDQTVIDNEGTLEGNNGFITDPSDTMNPPPDANGTSYQKSLFLEQQARANGEGFQADDTQNQALVFIDKDSTDGNSQPLIAIVHAARLGDFVWSDTNGNGIQNGNEPGINDVTVKLLRDLDGDGDIEGDEIVATTETGDNPDTPEVEAGYYDFRGLTPGFEYQVMFVPPEGFEFTTPNAGNGTNDSDVVDPINGTTDTVVLEDGEYNRNVDAGLVAAELDYGDAPDTYGTTNGNDGARHRLSNGQIDGVPVLKLGNLVDVEPDGQPNANADGDDINPANADDEDGVAFFDDDGDPNTITLKAGEQTMVAVNVMKMGTSETAYLNAWVDFGGDGVFDDSDQIFTDEVVNNGNNLLMFDVPEDVVGGMSYVRFRLSTERGLGATGIAPNGEVEDYKVVIEPLVASLGDFVFEDTDADGIQDIGEEGIPDAIVKLLDGNGDPILDENGDPVTTVTDGTGFYEFIDLTPGVEYKVMFVQPDGFDGVSPFQEGNDPTVDSDANPDEELTSDGVVLAPDENNPTIDAGFFKTAGIGDFVFEDLDADGIQDLGEAGIPNAEVKLLDENGDPVLDENGDPITTTTDATGFYEFTGLTPGDYKVMFVQPDGFSRVSPFQEGDDPTVDSDANPEDGLMSDVVNLESGEFDETIDAGFFKPAEIGDFVFDDLDQDGIQDLGEPGIPDAIVKLLDGNGDPVLDEDDNPITTTTDATGFYEFTGLTPGDYKIMFVQPDGFEGVSPFQEGDDPTVDSDANPDDGLMSDVVNLESGEVDDTIDAGFFDIPGASLGDFVFEDTDADGIQDIGEEGIPDAIVKLLDGNGDPILDENGRPSDHCHRWHRLL